MHVLRQQSAIGLTALLLGLQALMPKPAPALIHLDSESVDMALSYGMKHAGLGYSALLGGNWIEGSNGSLLNIYTPFMVLATRAARGGYPTEPDKADIQKAKKRYTGMITQMTDPKAIVRVKFSVSFFGSTPDFATGYSARIEGYGRGKKYQFKHADVIRQRIATQEASEAVSGTPVYQAVNAYYFNFKDIQLLDEYRLIVESKTGAPPLVFKIDNQKIY